jgi:hypothetical protein
MRSVTGTSGRVIQSSYIPVANRSISQRRVIEDGPSTTVFQNIYYPGTNTDNNVTFHQNGNTHNPLNSSYIYNQRNADINQNAEQ